ncbi:hypothetical protein M514_00416 [Trichuris suis]|uniref:Tyrosine-protein kinase n=1 Tax=Trichuris suis TaxID=68888 RepID=A0A085MNC7_9BILA|nr:hypothetical protein M513_00416 [Trichuris suis]KFD72006.1 hypothetical protein M514_00416 [Trichuris suis]KHJ44112.1 SH2 domain protein [Trichuris suis]
MNVSNASTNSSKNTKSGTPTTAPEKSLPASSIGSSIVRDPVMQEEYYYGHLPRPDTEVLLLTDGEFLVRRGRQEGQGISQFCISVRSTGRCHHIAILRDAKNKYTLEGPSFPTVSELIAYYTRTKQQLTIESGATIVKPVKRADWIIPNSYITLLKKIGEATMRTNQTTIGIRPNDHPFFLQGTFGEVWKAELKLPKNVFPTLVAIKFLKLGNVPIAEKKTFYDECRRMRELRHENVVRFKGVALDVEPVKLAMELCDNSMIYHLKNEGPVSPIRKTLYCIHIARGMEYLAKENCIHRDLAARNCLLKMGRVKIADLGMARTGSVYKMKDDRSKLLPIKWLPPDTLKTRVYSEKSDVWAFGITMWEIYSDAMPPYKEFVKKSNGVDIMVALVHAIEKGYRMTPPECTPEAVKRLMLACWNSDANRRPPFSHLRQQLEQCYKAMGGDLTQQ